MMTSRVRHCFFQARKAILSGGLPIVNKALFTRREGYPSKRVTLARTHLFLFNFLRRVYKAARVTRVGGLPYLRARVTLASGLTYFFPCKHSR